MASKVVKAVAVDPGLGFLISGSAGSSVFAGVLSSGRLLLASPQVFGGGESVTQVYRWQTTSPLVAVAVSPDGLDVACATADGALYLLPTTSLLPGAEVLQLTEDDAPLRRVQPNKVPKSACPARVVLSWRGDSIASRCSRPAPKWPFNTLTAYPNHC